MLSSFAVASVTSSIACQRIVRKRFLLLVIVRCSTPKINDNLSDASSDQLSIHVMHVIYNVFKVVDCQAIWTLVTSVSAHITDVDNERYSIGVPEVLRHDGTVRSLFITSDVIDVYGRQPSVRW